MSLISVPEIRKMCQSTGKRGPCKGARRKGKIAKKPAKPAKPKAPKHERFLAVHQARINHFRAGKKKARIKAMPAPKRTSTLRKETTRNPEYRKILAQKQA